jgi:hypothetical protein
MRARLGTVSLPPQEDVERRLLHFLYRHGRSIKPKDLYGPLADDFKLTQEQRLARRIAHPLAFTPKKSCFVSFSWGLGRLAAERCLPAAVFGPVLRPP